MLETIKHTANYINEKTAFTPETGIVLGTGLGGLVDKISIEHVLDYKEIPNFPLSTVEGHEGQLIFGMLGPKKVVAMKGRFHFYEGYTMEQVIFPIRVMKYLGIKNLLISNASGGMNPDFEIGDIMIITDHINLMPNPLIGEHYPEFGERFPDMSQPYNKKLTDMALEIAQAENIPVRTGCYLGVTGPTLETTAEYKFFRIIGGDAVGMSTVPEVIAAHQMGIPCFAVSIITDLGVPGKIVEVTHEDVQRAASASEPLMTKIIAGMLAKM